MPHGHAIFGMLGAYTRRVDASAHENEWGEASNRNQPRRVRLSEKDLYPSKAGLERDYVSN